MIPVTAGAVGATARTKANIESNTVNHFLRYPAQRARGEAISTHTWTYGAGVIRVSPDVRQADAKRRPHQHSQILASKRC